MRYGSRRWNLPVVNLRIFRAGIELAPATNWLKVLVSYWQVTMRDLELVEVVGTSFNPLASGLRFRTKGNDYRIFLCSNQERYEIASILAQMSVPVEMNPQKVSRWWPRF